MRYSGDFNDPREGEQTLLPIAGSLLLAHPSMQAPHFRHSVVLLTAHSVEDGALGVIVNRPLNQTLGGFDPDMQATDLADIPLYEGGPVASDRLILVAWKWVEADSSFKLFFGIDVDKARVLMDEDPEFRFRGFLGHSGWTGGQLEEELEQEAWLVSPLAAEIDTQEGELAWRTILTYNSPEMRVFADEPDDPSLN